MASGCIVVYEGKRGRVFRMKWTDNDGRQHMETLGPERVGSETVWTRRKAERALRDRLADVEAKRWRPASPLTFGEWARTWLEQGETTRAWKPRTAKVYGNVVERLCSAFGKKRLTELGPRDVAAYIAERTAEGFAPATVNRDASVLHDVLKAAVREELIDSNPAAGAERPRVRQKRWRILKPAEVARVARAFTDEQARVAFLVLVLCGLRRSELQALRWRDVDLIENVLRVVDSKTEDGIRSIAIPSSLSEALWQHRRRTRYRGDDELVFCHPQRGTTYRAEIYRTAFHAALRAAGVEEYVRPFHDARHTAITNDAASGSSPIAVMTKAGHSDMKTTKRYLHLAGVVFREEAQRLEQRYGLGPASTESSTEPVAAECHGLSPSDAEAPAASGTSL
jgi:integrase